MKQTSTSKPQTAPRQDSNGKTPVSQDQTRSDVSGSNVKPSSSRNPNQGGKPSSGSK